MGGITGGTWSGEPGTRSERTPRRIRALVVDDAEIMRVTVRMVLEAAPDVLVVGTAGTGEEALAAAAHTRPDVVVMDLRLPGVDGITVTQALTAGPHPPRVVVLSADDTVTTMERAFAAGASGYLVKGAVGGRLLEALRTVVRGDRYAGAASAVAVAQPA